MIFDTDVLIWCFRGNQKAAAVIDVTKKREISIVNYMELVQGVRDKKEMRLIRTFLKDFNFKMLPLTENIGARAGVYIEEYALKQD
jgi:predicted nucleic acid-binding protein